MRILSIITLILLLFTSCSDTKTGNKLINSNINEIQNNFIALVSTQTDSIYQSTKISNPIRQEVEYAKTFKTFNDSLNSFLTQNPLFINFKGTIEDISYEKGEKFSMIHFNLLIKHQSNSASQQIRHMKNRFKCTYVLENISKGTDSIYIKLQNINSNDIVYFNGFLNRNLKGNVSIAPEATVDGHITGFNFSILDIDKKKLNTLYSTNLNNAIKAKFKELHILEQCISENEDESTIHKKTSFLNLDSIMAILNYEEKQYVNKIQKVYTLNLARECINKR